MNDIKRESTQYCYKNPDSGEYEDFCPHPDDLGMYRTINSKNEQNVRKVKVFEDVNNESQYYGYWDNSSCEFTMVYGSLIELKVCSPNFFKREQELGKGKVCNVFVEEINE